MGIILVNGIMWICITKDMILFRWLPKEIVTNLKKTLEIQQAFPKPLLFNKENFTS